MGAGTGAAVATGATAGASAVAGRRICPVCGLVLGRRSCGACGTRQLAVGDAASMVLVHGVRTPAAPAAAETGDVLCPFTIELPDGAVVSITSRSGARLLPEGHVPQSGEDVHVLGRLARARAAPEVGYREPAQIEHHVVAEVIAAGEDAAAWIESSLEEQEVEPEEAPAAAAPLRPLPDGLTIARREPRPQRWEVKLILSWRSWELLARLASAVGLVAFLFLGAITKGSPAALVLLAAVTPILYCLVAHGINRTTITITPETLSVRLWPLPWPGWRSLPTSRIKRVYSQPGDGGRIVALLAGNVTVRLVRAGEDERRAFLVGRLIEEALGIPLPEQARPDEHRPLAADQIPDLGVWLGLRRPRPAAPGTGAVAGEPVGSEEIEDAGPRAGTAPLEDPPAGVRVERHTDGTRAELAISIPFRRALQLVLIGAFLGPFYFLKFRESTFALAMPWMALNIIAAGACVVGVYGVLARYVDRTRLVLDRGAGVLRVRTGPLPWAGNRTLPIDDLQQLYCRQVEPFWPNADPYKFRLDAIRRRGGATVTLLSGYYPPRLLHWVERAVEKELGLEQVPVEGEWRWD
jgi:hypothetical protein